MVASKTPGGGALLQWVAGHPDHLDLAGLFELDQRREGLLHDDLNTATTHDESGHAVDTAAPPKKGKSEQPAPVVAQEESATRWGQNTAQIRKTSPLALHEARAS